MLNSIEIAIAANVPVNIIDDPGTGKTSYINALCEGIGAHHELITLSSRLPEDLAWEFDVASGKFSMRRPSWATRLCAVKPPQIGVLTIDELTSASAALQAPALRIILDRMIGDEMELPVSTRRIAIMNPPSSSCGGHELALPTANRFCHLLFSAVTTESWCAGLSSNFVDMTELRAHHLTVEADETRARALVAAFYKANAQARVMPKNIDADFPAYPSRRSWTSVARLFAFCDALGASEEARIQLVQGCVGSGVALEFLHFAKKQDLGDPYEILAEYSKFKVDAKWTEDKLYVIVQAVVGAALSDLHKYWQPAWSIIAKVAEAGSGDIAGLGARQLASAGKGKESTEDVMKSLRSLIPLLRDAGLIPAGGK